MTAIMPFDDSEPYADACDSAMDLTEITLTQPLLTAQWEAINLAASEIAAFAQLGKEKSQPQWGDFVGRIATLKPAERTLVQNVLIDMDAMLEPGLKALRALSEQGNDVTFPALALWREFYHTRQALVDLVEAR